MTIPPAPTPALVGRERELTALREALGAAHAGRGSLAVIGGEAGIGKTTLVEAICAEAAEQGALVLAGRCFDLAETPPYGPWREVFARAPVGEGLPALPAAVLPPDRGGEALVGQEAILGRAQAFIAAVSARRPLLLFLDDLHWADPASLDLLRFLGRQLSDLPLLLIAAYRADELTRRHPLYALLPTLEREARATRLVLRPLDAAGIGALVASRYALPAADAACLVAWLLERAEGNAFFTAQLLRALEDEGVLAVTTGAWVLGNLGRVGLPGVLRQVLDARLAQLGEGVRHLLTLAAVVGQEVPLTLWAAVAETDEDGLLDAIERATEAHLVAETPDGSAIRFVHALIREALYESLLAARRRRIHRRAGEVLLAAPRPDPDAVASHLQRAGDPRAAEWLVRAGERAERAYAWLTAAARYEAALALLEAGGAAPGRRGWLHFRLAILRRFADPVRARADAEEAVTLAGEAGDPLLGGMATYLAGMLLGSYLGEPGRGLARMEEGLRALMVLSPEARVPPGAEAPVDPVPRWGTVVAHLAWVGRHAEALTLGERYLTEVGPLAAADWLGGNPHSDAVAALGRVHHALGRPAEASADWRRAVELNRAVGHHRQVWNCLVSLLDVVLVYEADRPAARQALLAEVAEVRALAQGAGGAILAHEHPPAPLVLAGRWVEARRAAETAQVGSPRRSHYFAPTMATLAGLDHAQGAAARARALVAEALPQGPTTAPGDYHFVAGLAMQRMGATLALDAGDAAGARAWLEAHDRWLAWAGANLGRAEGALGWSAYHRATGDLARARDRAAHALAQATEPRQPSALLAAHRFLGELDTACGRHTEAQAHLDAALTLADACEAPYERALTLLAVVELRGAEGRRDEATATLTEARALLEPLETRPALARADALAARLAAAPASAPAPPARPFGLTAREAEVLRLVAEGLSDAQVAERLFLSRFTVKAHLRAIYGKLGTSSRVAAARLAHDHHLT